MSPRQLSSRLITEVQQHVATFTPSSEDTDREQLGAFAKAVLTSVDIRDLRGTTGPRLVQQFQHVLHAMRRRAKNEILVDLRYEDDADCLVITTVLEDQPFLVSTLRGALIAEHYDIRRQLNAIVRVRRDPSGKLLSVGSGAAESVMRVEVSHAGASGGRDGGGI
ncbi:MAG: hypothetical protein JKY37_32490, partial [Nannocystaceae bacterium]|nr:hypothetical protein [Nannocystaceae bacterium]